jgi:hypothetical protein
MKTIQILILLSILTLMTSCSLIRHEAQRNIEQTTIKTIDNNIDDIVKKQLDEQLPKSVKREVYKALPEALPKAIEHGISNWVWSQLSTKGIVGLLASLLAFLGFKGIRFHIDRRIARKKKKAIKK